MVCIGIDVAKDKHDCFILSSEGEVLADVFTIQNNAEGFDIQILISSSFGMEYSGNFIMELITITAFIT